MPLRIALCDAEDAEKWRGFAERAFKTSFGRDDDLTTFFSLPNGDLPLIEDIERGERPPLEVRALK